MSYCYDHYRMPDRVSIKCPRCGSEAIFVFATFVKIDRRRHIDFFKSNDAFDYWLCEDSQGVRWHAAVYYHDTGKNPLTSIRDLPEGYAPEDWRLSQEWGGGKCWNIGTARCAHCLNCRKHVLDWPNDAFFQIDYKGKTLWAFNRESAIALVEFVSSEDRSHVGKSEWGSFLLHVPTHFLRKSARELVSKKLHSILMNR